MDKQKFIDDVRARLLALVVAIAALVTFFAGIFPDLGLPTVVNMDVVTPFIGASAIVLGALMYGLSVRNTRVSIFNMASEVEEREKLTESLRVKLTAFVEAVFGVVTLFANVFPKLGLPAAVNMDVAEPFIYVTAVAVACYIVARSESNVDEPI